jgi:hypothetical protein
MLTDKYIDGDYQIDVRVTNAQGEPTSLDFPVSISIDNLPPVARFVSADKDNQQITVEYSESFDPSYIPDPSDYTILQNGITLTVTSVAVSAMNPNILVLTIEQEINTGALDFTYKNNHQLVTDLAGNQLDQGFTQLIVSDGYIRGAEVYIINEEGDLERREQVTSDEYGQIILTDEFLSAPENTDESGNPYQVIIKGGVNMDSGAPNKIELTAPAGYAVINPLSTLVQEVASSLEVDVDTYGLTEEEIAAAKKDAAKVAAEESVAEALGISIDEGSSLGSYDPQSDDNIANRVVATQIATILSVASSTESADTESAETATLSSLAETISNKALKFSNDVSIQLGTPIDPIVGEFITVEVYLKVAGTVTLGFGGDSAESTVIHGGKGWETLTFDFSGALPTVVNSIYLRSSPDLEAIIDNIKQVDVNGLSSDLVTFDEQQPFTTESIESDPKIVVAPLSLDSETVTEVLTGVIDDQDTLETIGTAVDTMEALKDRQDDAAFEEIVIAQANAIDSVAPAVPEMSLTALSDTGQYNDDFITNFDLLEGLISEENPNPAPELKVSFDTTATDGSAVIVGDTLRIFSSGSMIREVLLTEEHIEQGFFIHRLSEEDAVESIVSSTITDLVGNTSFLRTDVMTVDQTPLEITSGVTVASIDENSNPDQDQVIYTVTVINPENENENENENVSDLWKYELRPNELPLSIDSPSGDVRLTTDPDYEERSEYNFIVVAIDVAGNETEQALTLRINNLDDTAPKITSAGTAVTIDENSGENQVVYTATADDSADASDGVTFSLADESLGFSIDKDSGVITTNADFAANYENAQSQSFTVVATDVAGNASQQVVSVAINNLDEVAPTITSGDTAVAIDENSGADKVVYTATADDSLDISAGVTFSLSGVDTDAFSIDSTSGAVTLTNNPDYETQSEYSFTVIASDGVNDAVEQSVTLDINNLDEIAPSITSGDTATAVNENLGAGQVVYTATATDDADTSDGFSFSLADEALGFSIDAEGVVTTNADFAANYEDAQSQSFTVVATDVAGNVSQQVVSVATNNLDEVAPSITSGDTATAINENTGADTVIYAAIADDSLDISAGVTFSLTGDSDPALSIDPSTGAVTLSADADYETQSQYSFTVVVSDGVNGDVEQSVTLDINNLDEIAPSITSGDTAVAIDENTGADTVIYTAIADDSLDISVGVTFSLTGESDPALSIDPSTGEVTLIADADYEEQSQYSFTVVASDGVNEAVEQSVTLDINNLDEIAPSITSGDTAVAIDENTGADTVIYTAIADDSLDISADVTFSLTDDSDPALSIDPSTGAVTLSADADYETQSVYSFTVVASDGVNKAVEQSVTLDINNLDEVAPSIDSGDTAVAIDENTGAGQVVYTAISDDSLDISAGVTFSLSGIDAAAFTINEDSGEVTLIADVDYETQSVYSFTVVASDGVNKAVEQSVTLDINNLDEVAPSIDSGDTAVAIDENTGAGQVVYTAISDDSLDISAGVTFSLSGIDAAAFTINEDSGEVTLIADVDYETQSVYSFTVVASDGVNGDVEQSVTLDINNLDEVAPSITSGDTADAIDENSGAGQVVYTAIAVDSTDVVDTPTADNSNDTGSAVSTVTVPDLVEATQHVYVSSSTKSEDGTQETIVISYNAEDTTTTGLGIRVHFDSSAININGISDIFQNGLLSEPSDPVADDDNRDGDTNTDQFVTLAWTSVSGNWPNSAPVDLATITFDIDEDATGTSAINFTVSSNAAGFDFDGQTHNLALYETQSLPMSFSLTGDSADAFSIDSKSGAVTLTNNPDYETQSQYSFAVIATDAAGNESEAQSVTLSINDLDDAAPTITSVDSAVAIDENSGSNQIVYTATADDIADDVSDTPITFSLSSDSDVALSIDSATGEVTLSTDPDHEAQSSYSFSVIATDAAGNESEPQSVTLDINNLDEVAPVINSGDTAVAINENSGASQVIYTATASDSLDISAGVTFSLSSGSDVALSIDSTTGAVTLSTDPDHETQSQYSFTVIADDGVNDPVERAVTLDINNLDEIAPTITSGATATAINENSGASQVIYTATADDSLDTSAGVTFSLSSGSDVALSIDSTTGAVTLSTDPDHETQSQYSFTVIADDGVNDPVERAVTLDINNLDEIAPTLTSGATAIAINENTGASQVVYTATASDSLDISAGVTFSLSSGSDVALSIDSTTGAVTLSTDPDHETQSQYSFTVIADDGVNDPVERAVTLDINNLDEIAPSITSGATATAINENSGASQVIYTATADDSLDTSAGVTFSLSSGSDVALSIDSTTGAVTLSTDPDHETQSQYSFTVIASDGVNADVEQAVTLDINDLDEIAPTITSGATATAINENSGASQVIYTATASDSLDISAGVTFSLSSGSDVALSIDSTTGAVTLSTDPDHETQSQYSFTVIASDGVNADVEQLVTLDINNLDEIAPSITSGATATAINENSGASQVIYTATASDSLDISAGVTFSLSSGSDVALSIDSTTGAVTLSTDPDHETQSQYSFTVIADDGVNDPVERAVTLDINNLDEIAPTLTSGATAIAINENTGASQVVYTATASDSLDISAGVTFSLSSGSDVALSIDSTTGAVTLSTDPDHETQSQYSFTVIADDGVNDPVERAVTLDINNLDEIAPSITSGATATAINENSGASQVIYTATASDSLDISAGVTFSLSSGSDAALSIDSTTGAVTLSTDPDHETQSQYSFTVIASDGVNADVEQLVTLDINNLDEVAPTITSDATATAINENSGAGQVIYTATADDSLDTSAGVTFSLSSGSDAALSIDSTTGAVTLSTDPDHEAQSSYSFAVIATDAAGNESEAQSVTLDINNLDEIAPSITSGATAIAINENSGASQVIYTATADDSLDTSAGVTFSLSSGSDVALSIDSLTGAVTLSTDPDHETQSQYSFTVIASDGVNADVEQLVTLDINNLDEVAPSITSGDTATAVNENSGADQVVYTATATDDADTSDGFSFSLADNSLGFSIDADTGVVTTNADFAADYENAQSQSFTVVATDVAGKASQQLVNVAINNLDEVAPVINSGATATAINENSGEGQVIYTATATDDADTSDGFSFSLADNSLGFSIDADTGVVTTNADFVANYEDAQSQSFTVVATDVAGKASQQVVSVAINNLDEIAPTLTSGATAIAINENTGASQVVYTATASDSLDISAGVTFSLSSGSDVALSIDSTTGAVTLSTDPDHETQSQYSFTVIASDGVNADVEQLVTLDINNLDEIAPSITSGATATAINENSGASQVVYTATASDSLDISAGVTFSLSSGSDAALSIDSTTGAVTLSTDPDHETQSQYSFTVIASDGVNADVEQLVTLDINNLDEIAPTITSGATATAINENSGASQVIYTATASDSLDISAGVTFSLSSGSDAALSIDSATGAVTLSTDPDHEAQSSYSFAVIATDAAGNESEAQSVTLDINNLDEIAPSITSGATAIAINENSGASQVIYTATADDSLDTSAGVTFSLSSGSDVALSIDSLTGAVTLSTDPDHETQSQYSFTVIADDGVNDPVERAVILDINNLDEIAPTLTSGDTATAVNENSGAGQVVYTATATDDADTSDGFSFSLADESLGFSIDADTGIVTTNSDFEANFEDAQSQSFTVVATDVAGKASQQVVSVAINNLDEIAPTLTSGATATAINENSGASQVIYTATADDSLDISAGVTFSLSSGSDVALSIDSTTGAVTLSTDPDHEAQSSYSFAVIATDAAGNESEAQSVTLDINNLDEIAPSITSGATATAINENTGASQVIYTATADDSLDISAGVTFSLSSGSDVALSIDSATGAVTLSTDPDHETQSQYSFTVIADDGVNDPVERAVILDINNLDEIAPTLTSGATATAINENSGASQVIYTATADDSLDISAGVTFSLSSGSDVALSIDSTTGAVTLSTDPDHETQSQYSFTVIASDGVNADVEQLVTLDINNLDEIAPTLTSGATATAINENTGASQVIYTATASDSLDISAGVTFSLSSGSDVALSIDSTTGAVTLSTDPDHEAQSSYSFAVIATDAAGNESEAQSVTLDINNLDEIAPSITSGATATAINENTGASQVIYTATADDSLDISAGVTFSLTGESDTALSIDPSTGAITLSADADHETQSQYSFTVIADDGVNDPVERAVTLDINDLDEIAPSITSGDTAVAIDENTGAGQVVYTATATDDADTSDGFSFSLADDSLGFSIDASTGVVTTNADFVANHEDAQSQSFTVIATDVAGNVSAQQVVNVAINNLDEVAPSITSGATATAINENSGASQVIYTATASDSLDISAGVTFSLSSGSDAVLSIDSTTGAVTLSTDPDHETQSQYSFTVIASDGVNTDVEQLVTLDINNLDEIAPTITSGATATAINENTGASQVIYTATASDSLDISAGVTFSLSSGSDAALSIDSATGAVTLSTDPDHETQSQYSFTVIADDGVNDPVERAVILDINNLDEIAPTITSGATATAINENSGASQVIYTATASDSLDISAGVTFSLSSGSDVALSIDSTTGAVTLSTDPDHETQSQYSFTVIASDGVNADVEQLVTLDINNLDEIAPSITSGATATAINENSGASQVIYTATASDSLDISAGVTFSLSSGSDVALSIDSTTGAVTLSTDPDHETQSQYSFTVIADDGVNDPVERAVTLDINNLDEIAPSITSGATATAINENTGASQVVYTATASDSLDISAGVTFSLSSGSDVALSIDSTTGAVTLSTDPDHETQSQYSFTVIA